LFIESLKPTISRIVHSKKNHAIQAAMGRQGPAVANGSTVCEICDETPTDRVVSSCCGAAFCRSCVMEMMSLENLNNQDTNTRCPSCRNPFSIDLSQECQHIVDDATLTISSSSGSDKSGMPSLKEMSHVASGSILRRIDLGEFATSTKVEVSGYSPPVCVWH
jgi:DNA repair protein RAD16